MARWILIYFLIFPAGAAPYQSAGTRKMSERLEQITRSLDPMLNPFLNQARVEKVEAQLKPLLAVEPTKDNFVQRYRTQVEYATELMNAGKPEEAFRNLKDVETFLKKYATFEGKEAERILLRLAVHARDVDATAGNRRRNDTDRLRATALVRIREGPRRR